MKYINGIPYLVEDAKLGQNDWRICRLTDLIFSKESFPTEAAAYTALNEGRFSFYE